MSQKVHPKGFRLRSTGRLKRSPLANSSVPEPSITEVTRQLPDNEATGVWDSI